MGSLLQFLKTIRALRDVKRQGVLYYGVKEKDVDSATEHSFRLALMVWLFGEGRKLNLGKAMKLALVHDLCKVYTGDITPYQGLFDKNDKKYKLAWRWRRLSLKEKERRHKEKFKKEQAAMRKLTSKLPQAMKKDIMSVWEDYQKVESPEAKFVLQVDRAENLLEALECFEQDRSFPTQPW
ncbi:MAG: HD domain-containing protein, partial [bacterium]|nr:HD domain-containing protein [bacterium]